VAQSGRAFLRRNNRAPNPPGTFRSVPELKNAVLDYVRTRNKNPKPFAWTMKASAILRKVRQASRAISEAGH
jgi:hypothetical protein